MHLGDSGVGIIEITEDDRLSRTSLLASGDDVAYIDSFYPYLIQQYSEEDLNRIITTSEYFKDDFNNAYRQFIAPNS